LHPCAHLAIVRSVCLSNVSSSVSGLGGAIRPGLVASGAAAIALLWLLRLLLLLYRLCAGAQLAGEGIQLGQGVLLAVAETVQAKLRLFRAPQFLGLAFILSLLGMMSHIILEVG
jgi:hypothetical protein